MAWMEKRFEKRRGNHEPDGRVAFPRGYWDELARLRVHELLIPSDREPWQSSGPS